MHGRKDDDSDFVLFNLQEDVNCIFPWQLTENSSKTIAFHTSKGSYIAIHLMRDADKAYKPYGFESYDRSTLVNINKVESIEPTENGSWVHFFDGSRVHVRKKIRK